MTQAIPIISFWCLFSFPAIFTRHEIHFFFPLSLGLICRKIFISYFSIRFGIQGLDNFRVLNPLIV